MKTAEAARSAGIKISTIRFYERQGLIEAQSRSSAGYRQFTNEDVRRLKFIKRAQELGFSLAEIRRFLAFSNQRVPLNRDVVLVGREKLDDLNRRIQALTRMRSARDNSLSRIRTGASVERACFVVYCGKYFSIFSYLRKNGETNTKTCRKRG